MKTKTTKLLMGLALAAVLPATAQDVRGINAAGVPETTSNATASNSAAETSSGTESSEIPEKLVIRVKEMASSAAAGLSAAGPAVTGGQPTFGKTVNWNYVNGGDVAVRRTLASSGPETFLGVSVSAVSPEISTHLSLQTNTGLLVDLVEKGRPAEKAGLQDGDILAKLDDQILILPQQLSVLVSGKTEGDAVKLTFLRKGQLKGQNVPTRLMAHRFTVAISVTSFESDLLGLILIQPFAERCR